MRTFSPRKFSTIAAASRSTEVERPTLPATEADQKSVNINAHMDVGDEVHTLKTGLPVCCGTCSLRVSFLLLTNDPIVHAHASDGDDDRENANTANIHLPIDAAPITKGVTQIGLLESGSDGPFVNLAWIANTIACEEAWASAEEFEQAPPVEQGCKCSQF